MKLNKLALACGVTACLSPILATPAFAKTITGQVVTNSGEAIANAAVLVRGSNKPIITDENGKFSFDDGEKKSVELHTTAAKFSHDNRVVNTATLGSSSVTIVLNKTVMEVIDVYATPLHSSTIESAVPVNVISGDALKLKHSSTLGETLKNEVGVHSTYYGPVASSPIIRGLDGPRVLITQNGLDVSDASRVGPDHVVSTETSTATQIEVLRGPATLFYGSGAIGGVVNVVDNRVPTDTETQFDYMLQHNTVSNENEGSFNLNTGKDNFAFHLDAFARKSDDYSIPGHAELDSHDEEHHDEDEGEHHEDEHHDGEENYKTLENSSSESSGFTVGGSYLLDNGFIGASFGSMEREYGIPGHSHGHHDEHDEHAEDHDEHEGEHDEHEEDGHEEALVRGKLKQDRFQLLSDLNFEQQFINRVAAKLAYTQYQHQELEDGEVGTQFNNDMFETRFDFYHAEVNGWKGAWTVHYKSSDFKAEGEEAFTPPSKTDSFAVAWLEEKHFGDVLVQFGARAEKAKIKANVLDDEHEHHEEEHHEETEFKTQSFTPISASLGAVWDYQPGYNLGVSFAFSQRAPSASELFSNGAHIGTNTYEVGALYDIHVEDDEIHIELGDQKVNVETSYNADITWRKFEGDFGFVVSAFYNQINDYYFQYNTGLYAEAHGDHFDISADDDEGLPIYKYTQEDARLYGFESEFVYQINDQFKTTVFADYINAKLVDGDYLPRTPPMRVGAHLDYQHDKYSAKLSIGHYFDQKDVDEDETTTKGYTMVDANFNYYVEGVGNDLVLFVKGQNLLNEDARVHSSFLKNNAPLPGRNFGIGIRGSF